MRFRSGQWLGLRVWPPEVEYRDPENPSGADAGSAEILRDTASLPGRAPTSQIVTSETVLLKTEQAGTIPTQNHRHRPFQNTSGRESD